MINMLGLTKSKFHLLQSHVGFIRSRDLSWLMLCKTG